MAEVRTEPSMEEILASIKRIIADDGAPAAPAPRTRGQKAAAAPRSAVAPVAQDQEEADDEAAPTPPVLELTEPVPAAAPEPIDPPAPPIVSDDAAIASRHALAALSALVVRPGGENTLEGLVRDMLRPMLKEWLDANLPELVEGLVAREIARITGKSL